MVIKSANKRGKIGKKLILSYMLVLIIAFLVVGITFKIILTNYLFTQARRELVDEGKKISELLSDVPLERERIREKLARLKTLKIAGEYINSSMIILSKDRKPIYTTLDDKEKRVVSNFNKYQNNETIKKRGYIVESIPVKQNGSVRGYVVLLTKVRELNGLNRIRTRMVLLSFIPAAIIALIISLILERSLVKPIMKLRNAMTSFSFKDFNEEVKIKTNDEIEELASSFNTMSNKLRSYDEQQRIFLQNASHELKTPLMSIQGYAEGIKDGVIEGEDLEESLDIIIEESQRLKKLVEEIIYLTKLENIEESFEFKEANINEIAENAIKSINSLALDKGLEIELDTEDKGFGNYDVEKMKRVFINLIGNAIRYAKKNILVSIKDKGEYRVIEVIDDGQGFQNDEHKKIFERFYKGEKGGSGIGLAITQAIIKGHGGTISAYNHDSLGAVFRINLYKKS